MTRGENVRMTPGKLCCKAALSRKLSADCHFVYGAAQEQRRKKGVGKFTRAWCPRVLLFLALIFNQKVKNKKTNKQKPLKS